MKDKITLRRERRKYRIRKKIRGTSERPRLSVHRTLKNIHAQLIDDLGGVSLLSVSTSGKTFKQKYGKGGNKEAACAVGKLLAEKAKAKGITKVKFDKGRFVYIGRLQALADSARENGLIF